MKLPNSIFIIALLLSSNVCAQIDSKEFFSKLFAENEVKIGHQSYEKGLCFGRGLYDALNDKQKGLMQVAIDLSLSNPDKNEAEIGEILHRIYLNDEQLKQDIEKRWANASKLMDEKCNKFNENISNTGRPSEELIISLVYNVETSPSIIWKKIGNPCTYELEGKKYSYLSVIVDISFAVMKFNEPLELDQERIFNFIKLMTNSGCNINYPHPITGHLPIHTSVSFYLKNMELAKYIILKGGDLEAKIPSYDKKYPNMNAVEVLQEIIEKQPPQKERIILLKFIKSRKI